VSRDVSAIFLIDNP